MMTTCNAFLINADTIMTNNHCISTASKAFNVTATFRDNDGQKTTYPCHQMITIYALFDFTLLKWEKYSPLKTLNILWTNFFHILPKIRDEKNFSLFIGSHLSIFLSSNLCRQRKKNLPIASFKIGSFFSIFYS